MKNEKPYAGLLKPEHLYSMLRAYIIEHAPFALSTVVVSDVINAYRGLRANGTKTYAKEITNCYN